MAITLVKTLVEIAALGKKIGKFTQINNHNESVRLLAEFLEDKPTVEIMDDMAKKCERNFGMDYKDIQERREILHRLLNVVLVKYGEDARKFLYMKF